MPPARGTGTLTVGGQPPGSVVTNFPGVGMVRQGFEPEVNGRAGSGGTSTLRAMLSAAAPGRAEPGRSTTVGTGGGGSMMATTSGFAFSATGTGASVLPGT